MKKVYQAAKSAFEAGSNQIKCLGKNYSLTTADAWVQSYFDPVSPAS